MGQASVWSAALLLLVSVCSEACAQRGAATNADPATGIEVGTPGTDTGVVVRDAAATTGSSEALPNPELEVGPGVAPGIDASRSNADGGALGAPDAATGLLPGSLEGGWMHGAANCAESTDPELQIKAYNSTTYVIRQDKCRTFEAPFVYLLIGTELALLLDTGAINSGSLRDSVAPLVGARALLVAHTHGHGDHVASDSQFRGQPATTVIGTGVAAVQTAFGINPWPTGVAEIDLGARVLDVLAIPGHEQSHVALYDRQTGLLFTGDTLYAGLLFINDWATYRASVRRLAEFVLTHPVSHVLGAHIEMTSTPGLNYPYGTTFQPNEHALELQAAHVLELDAALTLLGPTPPLGPVAHDDFVIDPQ